ncbi:MAG TPA: AtpZ/AtpI family protein, partial [Candidatus Limnocylindria bacterium]|nr:AtpZ/AtpI family protein [Candidatus Limnocylindria bacterium]
VTDKQDRRELFRELGKYSALGLELAIAVILGLAIGYYLDKWLGTGPWMTVIWMAIGFAAGLRSLFRAAIRSGKDLEKDEEDKRKPGGR